MSCRARPAACRLVLIPAIAASFIALTAPARSYESKPPFEPALRINRVTLGSDQSNPGTPIVLTCYVFPQVMVKVVTQSGPGSTISYLPLQPGAKIPACGKAKLAAERNFPGGGLGGSGAFVGVAGNDLILGGYPADGLDAREIYDITTGKRRFQDLIKLNTELREIAADGETLRLRYTRGLKANCSVLLTGGAACAQALARKASLRDIPLTLCQAAYDDAINAAAQTQCKGRPGADTAACASLARRQTEESPTLIAYDVEVSAPTGRRPVISPLGDPTACWPSE